MTDLFFPLSARISSITPKLVSTAAEERSIFTGAALSLARSGDHVAFDLSVQNASDKEAYALRAALRSSTTRFRGPLNRIWFADPSYLRRGSFPLTEAVVNGMFASGATGWSTSGSSLIVADRIGRVQNSGAAAGSIVSAAAMSLASGTAYAVRVGLMSGNKSAWAIKCGTTSGASDILSSGALTSAGLYIGTFTAATANCFLSLICNTSTAADFVHFLYASITPCILINGAGQSGTDLTVSKLPASTNGLLLPGDRVQIGTQLNFVSAPLNSDGSGNGYLQCDLPWRVTLTDQAPIVVSTPMIRAVSNPGSWDESPGGIASFSFSLEEALDA